MKRERLRFRVMSGQCENSCVTWHTCRRRLRSGAIDQRPRSRDDRDTSRTGNVAAAGSPGTGPAGDPAGPAGIPHPLHPAPASLLRPIQRDSWRSDHLCDGGQRFAPDPHPGAGQRAPSGLDQALGLAPALAGVGQVRDRRQGRVRQCGILSAGASRAATDLLGAPSHRMQHAGRPHHAGRQPDPGERVRPVCVRRLRAR